MDAREWLDDYALFMALKEDHGGAPWYTWEPALRARQPEALWLAGERLAEATAYHRFTQWAFFEQWQAVHQRARSLGIDLVGDMPIFVAHDSVEVWTSPADFLLHDDGSLRVQAGVPPDYFSATGQLWGNPLYDWARMEAAGFPFWKRRLHHALRLYDRVRIDHFRGFAAHWEVPGAATTAAAGRWVEAPGAALFSALCAGTLRLPLIAEDLGIITPDVEALRDRFAFPGMRVLQFAFGSGEPHLVRPYSYRKNLVVYTSTHDNDTFVGWYDEGMKSGAVDTRNFLDYVGLRPEDARGQAIHQAAMRLALCSVADTVILPVQDVLGLPTAARMNRPGQAAGNWGYRLLPGQLAPADLSHLHALCEVYGRLNP